MQVTTLDIRSEYKPDIVGSVVEMPCPDNTFDMILVCEVLEHLPFEDFLHALSELHRVTRHAVLISLPDARTTIFVARFKLPFTGERQIIVKIPNLGRIPSIDAHHFELGRPHFSFRRMRKIFRTAGFKIEGERSYVETLKNYYFMLEKT